MATGTENTAAGIATSVPDKAYSPDNLLRYHTSLALIDQLVDNGLLTHADYAKSCTILTRKYGLPQDGIFAEIA